MSRSGKFGLAYEPEGVKVVIGSVFMILHIIQATSNKNNLSTMGK